jgi:hypothetical protein
MIKESSYLLYQCIILMAVGGSNSRFKSQDIITVKKKGNLG